jgi:hypothetical protein
MLATSKGHASVVQILVNAKANLNLQNKVCCGCTSLFWLTLQIWLYNSTNYTCCRCNAVTAERLHGAHGCC